MTASRWWPRARGTCCCRSARTRCTAPRASTPASSSPRSTRPARRGSASRCSPPGDVPDLDLTTLLGETFFITVPGLPQPVPAAGQRRGLCLLGPRLARRAQGALARARAAGAPRRRGLRREDGADPGREPRLHGPAGLHGGHGLRAPGLHPRSPQAARAGHHGSGRGRAAARTPPAAPRAPRTCRTTSPCPASPTAPAASSSAAPRWCSPGCPPGSTPPSPAPWRSPPRPASCRWGSPRAPAAPRLRMGPGRWSPSSCAAAPPTAAWRLARPASGCFATRAGRGPRRHQRAARPRPHPAHPGGRSRPSCPCPPPRTARPSALHPCRRELDRRSLGPEPSWLGSPSPALASRHVVLLPLSEGSPPSASRIHPRNQEDPANQESATGEIVAMDLSAPTTPEDLLDAAGSEPAGLPLHLDAYSRARSW